MTEVLEVTEWLGEVEFKEAINKARGNILEISTIWMKTDWDVQEKHSELFRDILVGLGSRTDEKCKLWFCTSPDIVTKYPEMLIEIGKEALEKQNTQIIGLVYLSANNNFESVGLLNSLEFREFMDKLRQKPKLLAEVMLEHPLLQQLSELRNEFFIGIKELNEEGKDIKKHLESSLCPLTCKEIQEFLPFFKSNEIFQRLNIELKVKS